MCIQKGKDGDKMIRLRKAYETEENLLLVYVKKIILLALREVP